MKKMVIDYVALEERGWKIGFFLLPVVGLALIGWGWLDGRQAGKHRDWPKVDAVVLEARVDELKDGDRIRYAPKIQYRYFMDDRKFESGRLLPDGTAVAFESRVRADEIVSAHAVGANVKARIDPSDSSRSFLFDPPSGGIVRFVIGGVLLLLFVLTEIHHHTRHDEPDTDLHLEDAPAGN